MRIAIISVGVDGLPLPPVRGGAVENLIFSYLKYNDEHYKDAITVFSCDNLMAREAAKELQHCSFRYISVQSTGYIISRIFRYCINKHTNKFVGNAFISRCNIRNCDFDAIVIENRPEYGLYLRKHKYTGRLYLHLHNDILNASTKHADIICGSYDKIITVSDYIRSCVLNISNKIKINVLYNGIDVYRFRNAKTGLEVQALRAKHGFLPNDFVILFSGRVNQAKGIKELMQAFLQIPAIYHAKLLVVGSSIYGQTVLDEFTSHLRSLSEQRQKDIVFTGYINYDNMPSIYGMADLVVIPSIWEDPSPLTVYESLSVGVPLIVSDSGGIPEIVRGSMAVVIKRDGDYVKNLKDAILRVMFDVDLRQRMSEENRKCGKDFSVERYCNGMHRLIGSEAKE
jgi:spore coat protein SA